MNGKYEPKKHGSMAEYFMVMGQQARFLDPVIPMGELIPLMVNHCPVEVRSAIIVSKPQGSQETVKRLKELQPSTKFNFQGFDSRARGHNEPVKKSESTTNSLKEGAGHSQEMQAHDEFNQNVRNRGTRAPQETPKHPHHREDSTLERGIGTNPR